MIDQAAIRTALAGLDALAPPVRRPPDLPAVLRRVLGVLPAPVGRLPTAPVLRMAAGLAARPLAAGGRGADLAVELLRVGLGRSDRAASVRDPVLRRLVGARLAARAAADALLDDAGLGTADRDRLRAALDALLPAAGEAAAEDPARLVPGEDVAVTPGAVVLRTPVFELIQYLPRTEVVRAVPLLVVPPLANRHYLVDLAPGRSLVEHLVAAGQQVLALSWGNPGPDRAGDGLDAYALAVLDAMDAAERITRTPVTALLAVGSATAVTLTVLGHLAAVGAAERTAGLVLAVAPPDRHDPLPDPPTVTAPAPELLAWAADPIRVAARLRTELAGLAAGDALAHPATVRVLGTPIDLSKIDRDTYLLAGAHGRWHSGYRITQLLGGECRFVLADGGPVEAMARPGGTFLAGPASTVNAERWPPTAARGIGSWWADLADWLGERCGPEVDAPPELGGRGLHAVAPTPGDYVRSP